MSSAEQKIVDKIDWSKGLVPTVVVERSTGKVLMLAYSNRKSLEATLSTGRAHFWSRSRAKLWMKGEESGNVLFVKGILYDCDADTLIFIAERTGPVCHTGRENCFFNVLWGDVRNTGGILFELEDVVEERKKNPSPESWTSKLLSEPKKIVKKIMEEAYEFCRAVESEKDENVIWELADLLYHCLVALGYRNIKLDKVLVELERRRKEKAKGETKKQAKTK